MAHPPDIMSADPSYEDMVPERQRGLAATLGVKDAVMYVGRRKPDSLPPDAGVVVVPHDDPEAGGPSNGNGNGAHPRGADAADDEG
jgi:hypothetical protein